ncbi:MAG TPA: tRNA-dihydrouridine synthase [Candidatus Saccharimonadia bacterium]|nr:tRNA-dihydrouridine synthase [Candidatus Saccharimonadia bacterium]
MNNIYDSLDKPFTVLAPLDDVSDVVFRQIVTSLAKPDLFFTEFVNVDGLQSPGRNKLIHKFWLSKDDKPIIAQIWGKNPENYQKTAGELVDLGFDGIDINMGCPEKSVVKNGCCIALIDNRPLAEKIIKATKKGANGKLPVSVKTRIGLNSVDLTWIEFLLKQDLDALYVHLRTKKEMSLVPAHWELADQIRTLRDKISKNTLLIGNGDVRNKSQADKFAKKYGFDGIMIGRGIFADPYAFSDKSIWPNLKKEQRIEILKKHINLFLKTYPNRERSYHVMKRFCKIYVSGFDGAKDLRELIMKQNSLNDIITLLK